MVNFNLFRHFVPLHSLVPGDRAELARHAYIATYQAGQEIFHRGDPAKTIAYVISGEVELVSELGARHVVGETDEARYAISGGAQRTSTATCVQPAQLLFIDREKMDLILTWAHTGSVEVSEIDDSEPKDWMSAMLRNQAFHRIPPGNIAQIIASVEHVQFAAGDVIIRHGDPGDYYYVITEGQCQVVLPDAGGLTEREIDRIGQGRGFGEEALVSGDPRNATVRALSTCALVRLSAEQFTRLLRDPLLKSVALDALPREALLVDVRLPEEFGRGHLPGAISIPLRHLRREADAIDGHRTLAVYCDTGRRSASATFLLSERGFDARLVAGGVAAERLTEV